MSARMDLYFAYCSGDGYREFLGIWLSADEAEAAARRYVQRCPPPPGGGVVIYPVRNGIPPESGDLRGITTP